MKPYVGCRVKYSIPPNGFVFGTIIMREWNHYNEEMENLIRWDNVRIDGTHISDTEWRLDRYTQGLLVENGITLMLSILE